METNKKINLPQNPKTIQKKRLSQEQVRLLEASFDATKKLEPERKFQLTRELGVPPRQIAIWYQNKRARWKNQTLELDYSSIQLQLEAALAEKKRLGKEVDSLRGELKRAQDMLRSGHAPRGPLVSSSLSSGCDEGAGSSSLNDEVGNWGNGEALQFEELYACLMVGAAKGSAGVNPVEVNEEIFGYNCTFQ